jgi:hypothetical protein
MTEKVGTAELTAGDHALKIEFIQGGGEAAIKVLWQPAEQPGRQTLPAKALFHAKGAEKIEWDEVAWKKRKPYQAAPGKKGKYAEMDHGPFAAGTFDALWGGKGSWANKGIAIKLSDEKQAHVCFDPEQMRMASAWVGGGVGWPSGRDGLEGQPFADGTLLWGTKKRQPRLLEERRLEGSAREGPLRPAAARLGPLERPSTATGEDRAVLQRRRGGDPGTPGVQSEDRPLLPDLQYCEGRGADPDARAGEDGGDRGQRHRGGGSPGRGDGGPHRGQAPSGEVDAVHLGGAEVRPGRGARGDRVGSGAGGPGPNDQGWSGPQRPGHDGRRARARSRAPSRSTP